VTIACYNFPISNKQRCLLLVVEAR